MKRILFFILLLGAVNSQVSLRAMSLSDQDLFTMDLSELERRYPVKKSPSSRIAPSKNELTSFAESKLDEKGESSDEDSEASLHECTGVTDEELFNSYEQSFSSPQKLSRKDRSKLLGSLDGVINTISAAERDLLCSNLIQNINSDVFNKIVSLLFSREIGFSENLYYIVFRIVVHLYRTDCSNGFFINGHSAKNAAFFLLNKAIDAFDANKKNKTDDKAQAVKEELCSFILFLVRREFTETTCSKKLFFAFKLRALLPWALLNTTDSCVVLPSSVKEQLVVFVNENIFSKKAQLILSKVC